MGQLQNQINYAKLSFPIRVYERFSFFYGGPVPYCGLHSSFKLSVKF